MYLTKAMPIEGDDYKIHQGIRKRYPSPQKVLYQQTDCSLIIVSENKPINGFGQPKEIENFSDTEYLFSIRLNPSYRDSKTSKRVSVSEKNLREWISKIFNKHGFRADFQYKVEGKRKSIKRDKVITLASVFVMGMLTVENNDIFKKSFENGIGHAKSLGFGLLNIF